MQLTWKPYDAEKIKMNICIVRNRKKEALW